MNRVTVDAVAAGGDGIGRIRGKVVFIPGAIPGDTAHVEIVTEKSSYSRARLVKLVDHSLERVPMPCPHAAVCGGCTWQMVDRSVQLGWKHQIVVDALDRIGRLTDVDVRPVVGPGPAFGYRNRIDLHPSPGGPGFFRAGSNELVAITECLLAASPVAELLDGVVGIPRRGPLTIRAGIATGDSVVIGAGHTPPSGAVITERVAGVEFRISGLSFFQPNTDGAEALVALVRDAAGGYDGLLVDAFAGGGLFSGTLRSQFDDVIAIESNPVAAGDLAVNVPGVAVRTTSAEAGLQSLRGAPSVVVVDPPRAGLGRETVEALVGCGTGVVVSVSCDAATFARDARMLVDAGYDLDWVVPVDQFPQTPHVETVSRFVRG